MVRRPLPAALAVGAAALALVACGGGSSKKAAAGGATGGTATDQVVVQDYSFKPGSITVKKGTTVTWTFKDSDAHNVEPTGSGNPLKKSSDLKSGGTYRATFDEAGTFTYQCGIHNFMSGSVTVTG